MLETSKDILNIVIAVSIGLITLMIVWAMYYTISTLRNIRKLTVNARKKMETVDKILDLVKDKLEKGSNHMGVIADSAIKLVGLALDKYGKEEKPKGKKKKK